MEIINEQMIFLDVSLGNKEEVFELISKKLKELNRIESVVELKKGFYERENIATTYIGDDISIPHTKNSTVIETSVVYIRLKDEILWDSKENDYTKNIFAIAVPEKSNDLHIELLMKLSRKILNDEYIKVFENSNNIDEIAKIINE